MDIKSSEAVLKPPSTKACLCLKLWKMQDVGSALESCEEDKPRKAESMMPLMFVGSKSQRRHISVSFSDVTEKAGAMNKAVCALQFLPCILESRNSSICQQTELYQRVPESITCASSCLVHTTERKQSCWPKLLGEAKLPSCLYVKMKAQLLVHLLTAIKDNTILLIPAKQVWVQPMTLDRRALLHAGPQVAHRHSS